MAPVRGRIQLRLSHAAVFVLSAGSDWYYSGGGAGSPRAWLRSRHAPVASLRYMAGDNNIRVTRALNPIAVSGSAEVAWEQAVSARAATDRRKQGAGGLRENQDPGREGSPEPPPASTYKR